MKKMICVVILCVASESLQAQTGPSGSAVSTPATPAQKQQELAEARKRLAELQGELKSSQIVVQGSSRNSRYGGYGATSRSSTGSSRGGRTSTSRGGRGGSMFGSVPYGSWSAFGPHAGDTLIVPAQGAGPEEIINVQDDLQVMSRLFQKQLEQAGIAPPMMESPLSMYGMDMYGGGRPVPSVQSLYLAGYGTVFQLQVDFPLVAWADDQDKQDSKEDSVWAQTKLELLDPEAARRAREKDNREAPIYDPERVKGLKETLTKTLKYTRNIRALQPNEKVVIVVTSTADLGESVPMPYYTVLVMSAGKADIDQFVGGTMTLEQFQQKVQSMMY